MGTMGFRQCETNIGLFFEIYLDAAQLGSTLPAVATEPQPLSTLSECLFFRYIFVPLRWTSEDPVFQFLEAARPSLT